MRLGDSKQQAARGTPAGHTNEPKKKETQTTKPAPGDTAVHRFDPFRMNSLRAGPSLHARGPLVTPALHCLVIFFYAVSCTFLVVIRAFPLLPSPNLYPPYKIVSSPPLGFGRSRASPLPLHRLHVSTTSSLRRSASPRRPNNPNFLVVIASHTTHKTAAPKQTSAAPTRPDITAPPPPSQPPTTAMATAAAAPGGCCTRRR